MICELDRTAGRHTECPEESCAFWADGLCVVGGLRADWDRNPGLAPLLLDVRRALGRPGGRELVPPGLRD